MNVVAVDTCREGSALFCARLTGPTNCGILWCVAASLSSFRLVFGAIPMSKIFLTHDCDLLQEGNHVGCACVLQLYAWTVWGPADSARGHESWMCQWRKGRPARCDRRDELTFMLAFAHHTDARLALAIETIWISLLAARFDSERPQGRTGIGPIIIYYKDLAVMVIIAAEYN